MKSFAPCWRSSLSRSLLWTPCDSSSMSTRPPANYSAVDPRTCWGWTWQTASSRASVTRSPPTSAPASRTNRRAEACGCYGPTGSSATGFSHTTFEFGKQLLWAGVVEDVTETRRVRREAVALAEAAASLAATRSLDATLDALAQSVVETTSAVACGVYLLQEDGGLRTAGTFGLPKGYVEAIDAAGRLGAPRDAIRAIA